MEYVENVLAYEDYFALTGNPGTGKTTIAKLLGEILCENGYLTTGHLVERKGGSLKGEYIGHSGANARRAVEEALGGVLFIDEAYGLISTGVGDTMHQDSFGQDIVNVLAPAMTDYDGEFSLILAGYPDEIDMLLKSNSGWKSRFRGNIIEIEDYTPSELNQIFHLMAEKNHLIISEELENKLSEFFERWYYDNTGKQDWGNAREVESLISELKGKCGENIPAGPEHLSDDMQKFLDDRLEQQAKLTIDKLVGQSKAKALLLDMENEMEFNPDSTHKIPQMLFVGNPGTGKTTMAKLMGNMLKKYGVLKSNRIVEVIGRELIAAHVGETAERTKNKLLEARDGILFIDEAYQLLGYIVGMEAIDLLLDYSEPKHLKDFPVCIILAGYPAEIEKLRDSSAYHAIYVLALNDKLRKLYEDMTRELITEKRFQMLSARYDSEQLSSIEQFAEQISGYAGNNGHP